MNIHYQSYLTSRHAKSPAMLAEIAEHISEIQQQNTALRTAIAASTDMLRRLRRHYGRDFTDLDDCNIRSVIVANEAVLMKGGLLPLNPPQPKYRPYAGFTEAAALQNELIKNEKGDMVRVVATGNDFVLAGPDKWTIGFGELLEEWTLTGKPCGVLLE